MTKAWLKTLAITLPSQHEMSLGDLNQRHLRDPSETSQKRLLFATSLRRLKSISKNIYFVWRLYISNIDVYSVTSYIAFFQGLLSVKKVVAKISDNCQENTNAGISFWIKIGLSCKPATIFIKKDSGTTVFLRMLRTIFKNTHFWVFKQMDEKFSSALFRSSRSQIFFKMAFLFIYLVFFGFF